MEKRATFSQENVQELVRAIFPENLYTDSVNAQEKVLDFYLKGEDGQEKNNIFYLQKYTQIFSDLQFNIPIVWDILLRSKKKWPIYAYKSTYVNPGGSPKSCPIKSSFHGSDQRYLLLGKGQNHYFEMNEDDKAMEKLMVDSFVNFIKTGTPSSHTFQWYPTLKHDPYRYAELKPQPEMKNGLFADRVRFWTELAHEFKFDPVRMIPQPEGDNNLIYYYVIIRDSFGKNVQQ